ncbi:protein-L-isoaspartate(D-aspartate) O-methyltransferase [Bacteroidota bacterium]
MSGKEIRQEAWWISRAETMVESQIVARGITDKELIRVMKQTPRHLFVPERLKDQAYRDHPLPIGWGQTISQPYIVAIMTEYLGLSGDEKVLEIGTGSGYQAAILSQLVDTCYSIEVVEELANESGQRLDEQGYKNVVVKWGDGYKGWAEHAPFDRIIITAAPDIIPEKLVEQLAIGGRMVLPVGSHFQELILITKNQKGIKRKNIIPVRFVPMIHPDDVFPDN